MMRRAFSSGVKLDRVERDLGIQRRLVGIADPGELLDLAAPRLGVHPLHVALLADRQRRVDEDLDELVLVHQRPHSVARRPIRGDRGAHHRPAVAHDLAGHEADAQDVGVAVLAGETQALREMSAHHVAVELGHLAPRLEQENRQHRRGRRLAGAAQPGEPDAEPLAVARRIRLGQDLGRFRSREPGRQEPPLAEELLAHLGPGDRRGPCAFGNARSFFVAILIRQIQELGERHHRDADLVLVLLHQILRVIRTVERLAGRVLAGAGVVAPDDEVIGAVVAADDRVPDRLARSGHAHGQRQQRQHDPVRIVVSSPPAPCRCGRACSGRRRPASSCRPTGCRSSTPSTASVARLVSSSWTRCSGLRVWKATTFCRPVWARISRVCAGVRRSS